MIKDSIYSISEFVQNDIRKYRIIANPGCYPTSIQLPLIPLIKKNLINFKNIIIDSKSGYSGAGKNLEKNLHIKIYIIQLLLIILKKQTYCRNWSGNKKLTSKNINFSFNPHILPTFRGILSSIYVDLKRKVSAKKIQKTLNKYYKKDFFVKVLKINTNLGSETFYILIIVKFQFYKLDLKIEL